MEGGGRVDPDPAFFRFRGPGIRLSRYYMLPCRNAHNGRLIPGKGKDFSQLEGLISEVLELSAYNIKVYI
jgi:hypothetical protein